MTGKETIELFQSYIDPSVRNKIQVQAAEAQMKIHDMHSRAIACHCECMGMNAEDTIAACSGSKIPYSDQDYKAVMLKWGLINEDNQPVI